MGGLREWLKTGCLPKDEELKQELICGEYFFDTRNRIQLEPKEDIKARLGSSPDLGDALALTFAFPISSVYRGPLQKIAVMEYDGKQDRGNFFDPYQKPLQSESVIDAEQNDPFRYS